MKKIPESVADLIFINPARLQDRDSNIATLDDVLTCTNMHMYVPAHNVVQHVLRDRRRGKQTN